MLPAALGRYGERSAEVESWCALWWEKPETEKKHNFGIRELGTFHGHVCASHPRPSSTSVQQQSNIAIMLRRKPTAITVTSEDIAAFEQARLRQQEENKHPEQGKANNSTKYDPSDELKPLPGDKARIVRSREERIGIGRRG